VVGRTFQGRNKETKEGPTTSFYFAKEPLGKGNESRVQFAVFAMDLTTNERLSLD
jgi:hypothetical protein